MEVFLIRHAQSTNQVLKDRDSILFDPHLTELGERQAARLAEHFAAGKERIRLADSGLDRLVSSPMWRALQTTRPLAEALDLSPEVWVDVHEQIATTDVHRGSTREEILEAFPDYRLPDEIDERGWWNRGSETQSRCMERAIRVAGDLKQRAAAEESLGIVSHARFIDFLFKALLDQLPSHHYWYHHSNTAVSRLGLTEDRLWIRYLNRVTHLPSDLLS